MVRSLWTAATGMNAQQVALDNVANNLSNVNTTGYKAQTAEFKSLLYQTLQDRTTSAHGDSKPGEAQVGLGVRNSAISLSFRQGQLLEQEGETNFAIDGKGFFMVRDIDGETYYTRNGNFSWNIGNNNELALTDSDGRVVLDVEGKPISYTFVGINGHEGDKPESPVVTGDGAVYRQTQVTDSSELSRERLCQIGLVQFPNAPGLERLGYSLYAQSAASGAAINEITGDVVTKSKLVQGYLEGSNVQVADEMVNMIVTQRAYELNSKAITTSDQMMQQANNLRG